MSAGHPNRKGITLTELLRLFPDDQAAEEFFASVRWPDGVDCPKCGSTNVQSGAKHKTMPFRCRACRGRFSVRTGTVMEASNLGYQTWALAAYLLTTNLKGVSSLKLHRDLGVTAKTAWYLAHRLRKVWEANLQFEGPVEADETFIGGLAKNRHGRENRPKAIVVGMKDRSTKQVSAEVIEGTDRRTLHDFVQGHVEGDSTVYTDEYPGYQKLPLRHETVRHSAGEYVRDQAHTNGIESFWSMLKRGYTGTYHWMSEKHLDRYVTEFSGRHNVRDLDTIEQLHLVVLGMVGKRLRYAELTGLRGVDC